MVPVPILRALVRRRIDRDAPTGSMIQGDATRPASHDPIPRRREEYAARQILRRPGPECISACMWCVPRCPRACIKKTGAGSSCQPPSPITSRDTTSPSPRAFGLSLSGLY
jgi:hypothetical protein